MLERLRMRWSRKRQDDIWVNPRSAKPVAARGTWVRRRYWAQVRRNMIFAALAVCLLLGLAIAWKSGMFSRPPAAPAAPRLHAGSALHLR